MKRFAWVMMFLALGMFAYTGCGGPPAGPSSTTSEEDDLAESEMMGMGGDPDIGDPEDGGGEEAGGEEAGGEEAGGEENPEGQ